MAVIEGLELELAIERAEELRFWLLSLPLSSKATSAIQRELRAIIDDEGGPGGKARSLAGLTIAEFVAELHSPNGGAVGRVKQMNDLALRELRMVIRPARVGSPSRGAEQPVAPVAPVAEPAVEPTVEPVVEQLAEPEPSPEPLAPVAEEQSAALVPPAARVRGRPRRRSRGEQAPSGQGSGTTASVEPAPGADSDLTLEQLYGVWPSLHPHARRAVVLYASTLLAELADGR